MTDASTCTLVIHVTGLCLIKYDAHQEELNFLLLSAAAADNMICAHYPRLFVDRHCVDRDVPPHTEYECIYLDDKELRFPKPDGASGFTMDSFKQLLAVESYVASVGSGTFEAHQWCESDQPGKKIAARVKFGTGTATPVCEPKARWLYPLTDPNSPPNIAPHRPISHAITFTIPDVPLPVRLCCTSINVPSPGNWTTHVAPMMPRDGEDSITLYVRHVMSGELEPNSKPSMAVSHGYVADHFMAYRKLLKLPAFPLPILYEPPPGGGGTTVTCMPALTHP